MTDTSTTDPLAGIKAALSADWTKFIAFVEQAETATASFLSAVATGAEVAIADIEAVASYIAGKLGTITATTAALSTAAQAIAPGNVTVQKVIADLQTGANDVAALHNSLTSGSTAGDPAVVTTAVNAVNAVNILAGLAAQASSALAQATVDSPAATQAVSAPTPNEG